MEEAWRIPKPVGISSRGNCAMCKVGPLKILDKDPKDLCPTHSTGKKGGIPQRIPGLKGLPVIMANGSNLVFWGVNELVVSVAKPGMTI